MLGGECLQSKNSPLWLLVPASNYQLCWRIEKVKVYFARCSGLPPTLPAFKDYSLSWLIDIATKLHHTHFSRIIIGWNCFIWPFTVKTRWKYFLLMVYRGQGWLELQCLKTWLREHVLRIINCMFVISIRVFHILAACLQSSSTITAQSSVDPVQKNWKLSNWFVKLLQQNFHSSSQLKLCCFQCTLQF